MTTITTTEKSITPTLLRAHSTIQSYNDNEGSNRATKTTQKTDTVTNVLKAISDDKSLEIFRSIAATEGNSNNSRSKIFMSSLGLSKKQLYTRMSALMDSGLIRRQNGKYLITSLGKVVCKTQEIVVNAVNNVWKLKAIDSIVQESSANNGKGLPEQERNRIIEMLIDNHAIRDILNGNTTGQSNDGSNNSTNGNVQKAHSPPEITVVQSSRSGNLPGLNNIPWECR
jgi:DNA-binding HxlR family transcriptional regulator